MKPFLSHCKLIFVLLFGFCFGCATLSSLDVTYRTTPKSNILKGKEVYVKFIDRRLNKDIIGKGAKHLYKNFPGNVTFIVSRSKNERFNAGIYEIGSLFTYVFTLHLKNMGLQLLPVAKAGTPQLVITLRDFVLDLSGRRWIARIAYDAEFHKDGKVVVRKFKAEGEKYRVEGLTQAHQVMSQTFTEIVNQLDVRSLYANTTE